MFNSNKPSFNPSLLLTPGDFKNPSLPHKFSSSRFLINEFDTIIVKNIPNFQDKYKEEINIFLQCLYLLLYNKFIKHIKEEITYPYYKFQWLRLDVWQDYLIKYSPNSDYLDDENGPLKSLDISNHTYLHLISYLAHLLYHADDAPAHFYTQHCIFKFMQHIIKDLYFPSNIDIIIYEKYKGEQIIYAFDTSATDILATQICLHEEGPIYPHKVHKLYYPQATLPIDWLQPYYPYKFVDYNKEETKKIYINPIDLNFFSFFLSMCQEIDDYVESEGKKYPKSLGPVEYPVYDEKGYHIYISYQPTMIIKTESVSLPFPLFTNELPKFKLFWEEYKKEVLAVFKNI